MVRAYYYDNTDLDQRLPHDSHEPVHTAHLESLGLKHWSIPAEGNWETEIDRVAKEQGYKNRDTISVSREGLGEAYEEKVKGFFHEHLHEDEEIRYILSGSGFFDVREVPTERWIRIAVFPGDLLVVPAGIYHRFTVDEGNWIKALRLFKDEPKWVPHNRGPDADAKPSRKEYLGSLNRTV